MGQYALGDLVAVDVGTVARVAVAQGEPVVLDDYLRVVARNLAAGEAEVVRLASADFELALRDRHDAPAERIRHFQAGIGHEEV